MNREEAKSRVLMELYKHNSRRTAIGMGELFVRVYGEEWRNRINDTRALRTLITELRQAGVPICSSTEGGYWLARAGSDLDAYCRRLRAQALKKLAQEAHLRNKTLPELLGQIAMNLTGGGGSHAG